MANRRSVYDQELKETPEFKILYSRYYNSGTRRYKEAFATFQEFYDWSMANGFVIGAKLGRKNPQKPYSKKNCRWEMPKEKKNALYGEQAREDIRKWNEVVNRIRVHFGLEPFETEENNEALL